jgi:hypothetical protein
MHQKSRSKATYTLYYAQGAASFVVHSMLIHAGARYELIKVNLCSGDRSSILR